MTRVRGEAICESSNANGRGQRKERGRKKEKNDIREWDLFALASKFSRVMNGSARRRYATIIRTRLFKLKARRHEFEMRARNQSIIPLLFFSFFFQIKLQKREMHLAAIVFSRVFISNGNAILSFFFYLALVFRSVNQLKSRRATAWFGEMHPRMFRGLVLPSSDA